MATEREKVSPEGAELGEAIRKLRSARGLRVSDLADAMGVTDVSIKKLQRGVGTQHFLKFGDLCRLLGVTPNDLLQFNSIGSDQLLLGVLEASYLELGLADDEARAYAALVLKVMKEPPIHSVSLPLREMGRVQGETAIRRSGPLKRS